MALGQVYRKAVSVLSTVARELNLRVMAPSNDWLTTGSESPHLQIFGLRPDKSNDAGGPLQFLAYVIGRNDVLKINVSVAGVAAGVSNNFSCCGSRARSEDFDGVCARSELHFALDRSDDQRCRTCAQLHSRQRGSG